MIDNLDKGISVPYMIGFFIGVILLLTPIMTPDGLAGKIYPHAIISISGFGILIVFVLLEIRRR